MPQTLDAMDSGEVVWDPYKALRATTRPVPEIAFYEGLLTFVGNPGRSPYMPNRVLRQLGCVQGVPNDPVDAGGDYFTQWRNHVVDPSKRAPIQENRSDHSTSYMIWYAANSHPFVQNKERWVDYGAGSKTGRTRPADVDSQNESLRFWAKTGYKKLVDTLAKGKKHCGGPGFSVLQVAARDFTKLGPWIAVPPEPEAQAETRRPQEEEEDEEEEGDDLEEFIVTQRRKPPRRTASKRKQGECTSGPVSKKKNVAKKRKT